jgi:hypothetical protein
VAVPDLESIARAYLLALEKALAGEEEWQHHYEWLMLELYDQTVRERSGGTMIDYLRQDPIPNEAFVYERLGGEARQIIQALRSSQGKDHEWSPMQVFKHRLWSIRETLREHWIGWLLGADDYKALHIGRFRLIGEVHQWMYDRYSLAQLLRQAGFQNPKRVGPSESRIPNWTKFWILSLMGPCTSRTLCIWRP